jgi:hypothetical protein
MTGRTEKPHQFLCFQIRIDTAFLSEGGNLHGLVLELWTSKTKNEHACTCITTSRLRPDLNFRFSFDVILLTALRCHLDKENNCFNKDEVGSHSALQKLYREKMAWWTLSFLIPTMHARTVLSYSYHAWFRTLAWDYLRSCNTGKPFPTPRRHTREGFAQPSLSLRGKSGRRGMRRCSIIILPCLFRKLWTRGGSGFWPVRSTMWRLSLSCVPALPGFVFLLFGLSLALFCSSYINIPFASFKSKSNVPF